MNWGGAHARTVSLVQSSFASWASVFGATAARKSSESVKALLLVQPYCICVDLGLTRFTFLVKRSASLIF